MTIATTSNISEARVLNRSLLLTTLSNNDQISTYIVCEPVLRYVFIGSDSEVSADWNLHRGDLIKIEDLRFPM